MSGLGFGKRMNSQNNFEYTIDMWIIYDGIMEYQYADITNSVKIRLDTFIEKANETSFDKVKVMNLDTQGVISNIITSTSVVSGCAIDVLQIDHVLNQVNIIEKETGELLKNKLKRDQLKRSLFARFELATKKIDSMISLENSKRSGLNYDEMMLENNVGNNVETIPERSVLPNIFSNIDLFGWSKSK